MIPSVRQTSYLAYIVATLFLGLCATLAIFSYVSTERSSDRWIADSDRIHLVTAFDASSRDADSERIGRFSYFLGPALDRRFEAVEIHTRMRRSDETVSFGGSSGAARIGFIDTNFFSVFDFTTAAGRLPDPFDDVGSAVVTEAYAVQHYGRSDVIGEPLDLNHQIGLKRYRVEAVLSQFEQPSHLENIDVYVLARKQDFTTTPFLFTSFTAPAFATYLKLTSKGDTTDLSEAMTQVGRDLHDRDGSQDSLFSDTADRIEIIALSKLERFTAKRSVSGIDRPDGFLLPVFSLVGAIILLLSIFNYAVSTIASVERNARTISLRKILGESSLSTACPYFIRASVFVLVALSLSFLALNALAIVVFDIDDALANFAREPARLWAIAGIGLLTVALAAALPAAIALNLNPVNVLSGTLRRSAALNALKSGLVCLQLTAAYGLVLAAGIFIAQTRYLDDRPLGFDRDNLIALSDLPSRNDFMDALAYRLKAQLPSVKTSKGMVRSGSNMQGFPAGYDPLVSGDRIRSVQQGVEAGYFDVVGAKLLAGRWFSIEDGSVEPVPIIVNRALADEIGFATPRQAINALIERKPQEPEQAMRFPARQERIVGVVDNIHFQGRNTRIPPISYHKDGFPATLFIRIGDASDLDVVRSVVRDFASEPVDVKFVSDTFHEFYANERLATRRMVIAASLALLLSLLGVIGLAVQISGSIERSLAIRKVLGASVFDLVKAALGPFLPIIAIGAATGTIGGYVFASGWLSQFVYRVPVGAAGIALTVLFMTLLAITCFLVPVAKVVTSEPIEGLNRL